jgi:hypothetical protein
MSELNKLLEIITEVKNEMEKIDPNIKERLDYLNEDLSESGDIIVEEESKSMVWDYQSIPIMPISELGWASLESNTKEAEGSRRQLEQFLSNIPGADLRTKLQRLNKVMTDPKAAMKLTSFGKSQADKIASTLAYLVFFKTLTSVVTNFNAASAGFNFEAFLAVLMGGTQIPAAGAKTIADITIPSGKGDIPVSLKLYAEKSLKAGGSYPALVSDLAKSPGYMQYVAVAKSLEGSATGREGELEFYRYNLTYENIMNVLYRSAPHDNSELIRLPQSMIAASKTAARAMLKDDLPQIPPLEETREKFEAALREIMKTEWGLDDTEATAVIDAVNYGEDPRIFKDPPHPGIGALKGLASPPVKSLVLDIEALWGRSPGTPAPGSKEILKALWKANDIAREDSNNAWRKMTSLKSGASERYASARDSMEFYNRQTGPRKQRALLHTLGFRAGGAQFELTKADIRNVESLAAPYKVFASGQNEVSIGKLEIGQAKTQEILNEMITSINESVFAIFSNVKVMGDSLQTYFAEAMEDDALAEKAIEASKDIQVKTGELKDQT